MPVCNAWITEDQKLIAQTARDFLDGELMLNAIALENSGFLDFRLKQRARGSNLLGAGAPTTCSSLDAQSRGNEEFRALNCIEQGHNSSVGWGIVMPSIVMPSIVMPSIVMNCVAMRPVSRTGIWEEDTFGNAKAR